MPAPTQKAPARHLKPAGWIVIVLALGGALYWSYMKVAPYLVEERAARYRHAPTPVTTAPPAKVAVQPPSPRTPERARPDVLSKSLFPSSAPALPPPGQLPVVALPPLVSMQSPVPGGVVKTGSEEQAIQWVETGRAGAAVVSVATLAGNPKAIHDGVRAVWYVGSSRADGALDPACDPARLRTSKLGVVRLSLAHFHLLAQLAGQPLPPITEVESEETLAKSYTAGLVPGEPPITGGEALVKDRTDTSCGTLPDSAFSFVIIQRKSHPIMPSQLSAVVALRTPPRPDSNEVANFFERRGRTESPFEEIFDSAGKVWTTTHLIPKAASARSAFDPIFLHPGAPTAPAPAPAAPTTGTPQPRPAPRPKVAFGYPSWVDR